MKRSKIFLGIMTACLAVVGVSAAKSFKNTAVKGYYYTTATPQLSHCVGRFTCYTVQNIKCTVLNGANVHVTIFTNSACNGVKLQKFL